MADHSIGSDEPPVHEAEILVVVGEGVEPTAALREAEALRDVLEALAIALCQKGIAAWPSPDRMRSVHAPTR